MKYSAVIFDLDGTTLNTLDDLSEAVNYALGVFGLPGRTVDEVKGFAGNGVRKLIERSVLHGLNDDEEAKNARYVDDVYKEFSAYYAVHCADHTRPYDGVVQAVETIRKGGIKTAIVSNKDDYAVKELVKDILPNLFDYAVGVSEGCRAKPAPDTALEAMKVLFPDCTLDECKNNCVYVGDSEVDIETAGNAGLPCISVTWGFKTREFLIAHGAKIIVDNTDEMLESIMHNRVSD